MTLMYNAGDQKTAAGSYIANACQQSGNWQPDAGDDVAGGPAGDRAYHNSCGEAEANEDIGILCACIKSELHQKQPVKTSLCAMPFYMTCEHGQCADSRAQQLAHMSEEPCSTGAAWAPTAVHCLV